MLIGHCGIDCESGLKVVQYEDWLRASPLKTRLMGSGSKAPPISESAMVKRDYAINYDKPTGFRKELFREGRGESKGSLALLVFACGGTDCFLPPRVTRVVEKKLFEANIVIG